MKSIITILIVIILTSCQEYTHNPRKAAYTRAISIAERVWEAEGDCRVIIRPSIIEVEIHYDEEEYTYEVVGQIEALCYVGKQEQGPSIRRFYATVVLDSHPGGPAPGATLTWVDQK